MLPCVMPTWIPEGRIGSGSSTGVQTWWGHVRDPSVPWMHRCPQAPAPSLQRGSDQGTVLYAWVAEVSIRCGSSILAQYLTAASVLFHVETHSWAAEIPNSSRQLFWGQYHWVVSVSRCLSMSLNRPMSSFCLTFLHFLCVWEPRCTQRLWCRDCQGSTLPMLGLNRRNGF